MNRKYQEQLAEQKAAVKELALRLSHAEECISRLERKIDALAKAK